MFYFCARPQVTAPAGVDHVQIGDRVSVPFNIAYGTFFTTGQTMGTGQCPVARYNRHRRDLIISGRANPSFVVSHEVALDDAPDAYAKFDRRDDGYTKVLIHPAR